MKKYLPLILGLTLLACGTAATVLESRREASGPAEVVVVWESGDATRLPPAQVAMLNSLAVKKLIRRVDKDATGPDLPAWAILAAKGHTLPAWVTRHGAGKATVAPLPADEQAAMALLKHEGVIR